MLVLWAKYQLFNCNFWIGFMFMRKGVKTYIFPQNLELMKFRLLLVFMASMTIQAQTSDLVGMLTKEMGISEKQAEGGAGSIFNMAKETMPKSDFGSLSDVVPDMSGLLGAVPGMGKKSMLGKATASLTGMPAVVSAFGKLGLKESHIQLMTPLLVNYVEDKGGKALSSMFMKSVMP